MSDVTQIMTAIDAGDPRAAAQLLPLVYAELRSLAAKQISREKPGQTLQATALVHEAYVRLLGNGNSQGNWHSRGHFFAAAAEAMRRILVENARRKQAQRHGGGQQRVEFDDELLVDEVRGIDLLALDEALERLAEEDRGVADVVKLRFFAGMGFEEVAAALGISRATVVRRWTYARAWLHAAIGGRATHRT